MREIKSRAWDKKTNQIVEIISISYNWHTNGSINRIKVASKTFASDDESYYLYEDYANNFDIMEYSGCIDCDGNEIYEGDIVIHEDDNTPQLVIFYNGQFTIKGLEGNHLTDYFHIQIIGNIHENPELLT